jgi:hypothetical protein
MGFFDFLKPKSPEQKRIEQFEKIKSQIVVLETKSLMHDMILSSPHDDSGKDEHPDGIGSFGLERGNPIPVYGIDNVPAYMDKLRYKYVSKNSGAITFNPISFMRTHEGDDTPVGSPKPESSAFEAGTSAPNIEGTIDVYNIYSIGNTKLAKIFINSYSLKTSNKVPEGFFHRDSIPVLQDTRVLMALFVK